MSKQTNWKRRAILLILVTIAIILLIQYLQSNGLSSIDKERDTPFECSSTDKGKIDIDSNIHKHENKLALIVGNKAFMNLFGKYCETMLDMEVIQKNLKIASSLWIMDNDKFEAHPNYEFNEIHAPFWTNKEYKYRYNVHHYDYVYYFINKYNINLKDTFKLIDYSNKINLTCFVVITNLISNDKDDSIHQIQSYLKYYQLNHIIFKLNNVYIANDTEFSHNHDIALLFHQIMKMEGNNIGNIQKIFNDIGNLDILYFEDVIKYIAVSPLYQDLYDETFYIKSTQNSLSLNYLIKKMLNLSKLQSNDINLNMNENKNEFQLNEEYNIYNLDKFNCYFLSEKLIETSIDNILNIILYDLNKDKDLISRKSDYERFDKSAVFCDNRYDDKMVEIVLNYMINLDQTWQFELFVGNKTMKLWKENKYLAPYIKTEKIILKDLKNYYGENPVEYYQNIEFWKSIKYEKILIFQSDSVLCSYSKYRIEDFLEYDYVGAPWRGKIGLPLYDGRVGNGGLSLRTKSVMIKLLTQYRPKDQKRRFSHLSEDYFLSRHIALLSGVHLPKYSISKRFSTENDYWKLSGHEISAGIHRHYIKTHKVFHHLVKQCAEFNITLKRIHFWNQQTGWK